MPRRRTTRRRRAAGASLGTWLRDAALVALVFGTLILFGNGAAYLGSEVAARAAEVLETAAVLAVLYMLAARRWPGLGLPLPSWPWRWRRAKEAATLADFLAMSPGDFERAVAAILTRLGFQGVRVVGRSADGGVDIECADTLGAPVLAQCKRYAPSHPVGDPAMRHFLGAIYDRRVRGGIYVTTSTFTRNARETAVRNGVTLIDGARLVHIARGEVRPMPAIPQAPVAEPPPLIDARGAALPGYPAAGTTDIAARGREL